MERIAEPEFLAAGLRPLLDQLRSLAEAEEEAMLAEEEAILAEEERGEEEADQAA